MFVVTGKGNMQHANSYFFYYPFQIFTFRKQAESHNLLRANLVFQKRAQICFTEIVLLNALEGLDHPKELVHIDHIPLCPLESSSRVWATGVHWSVCIYRGDTYRNAGLVLSCFFLVVVQQESLRPFLLQHRGCFCLAWTLGLFLPNSCQHQRVNESTEHERPWNFLFSLLFQCPGPKSGSEQASSCEHRETHSLWWGSRSCRGCLQRLKVLYFSV